jgi:protein PhnA
MSDTTAPCPKCKSPHAYSTGGSLLTCPECNYEWDPADDVISATVIKDAHGNVLNDGDTVVIIKDLPVKGAPKAIKTGTKVKNIKLTYGGDGHNIDCKIDGFGAIALKSEFVKKG